MKAAFVLILAILTGTLLAVPNVQAHSPTMAGDNGSRIAGGNALLHDGSEQR